MLNPEFRQFILRQSERRPEFFSAESGGDRTRRHREDHWERVSDSHRQPIRINLST
jgi:hypothetical protein